MDAYASLVPALLTELQNLRPLCPANPKALAAYFLWAAVRHTCPDLASALSSWARKFHLTFHDNPADWAMDAALATLSLSRASSPQLRWCHIPGFHEGFPAVGPDWYSAGTHEAGVVPLSDLLAIRIEIPAWNRPGGESKKHFKDRFKAECDRVYKTYVEKCDEWTRRRAVVELLYADGLAMWQTGKTLSEVHKLLAEQGLNVGAGHPTDSNFNSAISKGLDRIADLIKLDRRQ